MDSLKKLKNDHAEYMKRYTSRGKKTLNCKCPNCKKSFAVPDYPGDTLSQCIECGNMFFKVVCSGKLQAKKLPLH